MDFGIANFLDRISYKQPKSLEKLASKFASSRRMAASEQPINTIDFTKESNLKDGREEE